MNPDLLRERQNATANVEKLKGYFGKLLFKSTKRHQFLMDLRDKMIKKIEPINYKFYNLDRADRYDFVFKKSLEVIEFLDESNIKNGHESSYLSGAVMGPEKQLFTLHQTMVRNSIELWANEEQRKYWLPKLDDYSILVTYAQTELGHGTYVRGLETTATYNKESQTFTLNSPTITSFKYWPGACK
jgi:acyl-CoA oxidase